VCAGLDPLEVVDKVQELCLKLVVVKVGVDIWVDVASSCYVA
jgi:hypothetical protein